MPGEQVLAGRWCPVCRDARPVDAGPAALPVAWHFVMACCDFHMFGHNSEAGVVLHGSLTI